MHIILCNIILVPDHRAVFVPTHFQVVIARFELASPSFEGIVRVLSETRPHE